MEILLGLIIVFIITPFIIINAPLEINETSEPEQETFYEIDNYRTYDKTDCRGIITSKCEDYEYIEVFYTDEEGKDNKYNIRRNNVKIGDKSEVKERKTDIVTYKDLYLTKEDYLEMWDDE